MTPRDPQPVTRDALPAEITPEALRELDFRTLRQLSRHGNGVLNAEEQRQFDAALADMRRGATSLVEESLRRATHHGPGNLDPELRRSYRRTQQRLAAQARRIQESLPDPAPPEAPADQGTPDDADPPERLEQEVEQTSDTLDLLEKIATLQKQQAERQETQLLSETRGLFFAFLVSVAIIIAGVAPLVEAEPHYRLLIVLWTVAVTVVAGLVYALVRAVQTRR